MLQGRTMELEYLNRYAEGDGTRIIIVYGHKGVGKTQLIKEFIKGRQHFYYEALSCSDRQQLFYLGQHIERRGITISEYPSSDELVGAMLDIPCDNPIIIIDEFHNMTKGDGEFIKELISRAKSISVKPPLILLLSSSVGWVENAMIGKLGMYSKSIKGFLKVNKLKFYDFIGMYPAIPFEDSIIIYSIFGGIPWLWNQIDFGKSLRDNIIDIMVDERHPCVDYANNIIKEELRETNVYNTILAGLASGIDNLNDLYLHTEFSRAKISVYLKNLIELELVEKVFSFETEGSENTKKGVYAISNNFINFYYAFIYPNKTDRFHLSKEQFYDKYIDPDLDDYVTKTFSDVCGEYLDFQNRTSQLPITYKRMGRWVGKQGTIEYMAQDEDGKMLIGISNWARSVMSYEDYEWLMFCAGKAKISPDYVYLFSATGFDDVLIKEAKIINKIRLIGLDKL